MPAPQTGEPHHLEVMYQQTEGDLLVQKVAEMEQPEEEAITLTMAETDLFMEEEAVVDIKAL